MFRPVSGSPTADTSASRRLPPQPAELYPATFRCQGWAANAKLQPPPVAPGKSSSLAGSDQFQTVSLARDPSGFSSRRVPPTATVEGNAAGTFGIENSGSSRFQLSQPKSPVEATIGTPGWV